ncbi:DNA polymerase III subunit beta [Candidatus Purcelliella pentastirinorum]|uniref:DNA polymerase III subunit beta n=1 Tax=Candidatus Purcelliella pentastirinorum TaxID=472834 RepID=UPI002368BA78|nr:DNA polymerase III subunit beta [Candidatus Purcelliella pentastirinorum]WDI79093.1 DNA polymerase III subunit beta [Candidatus Purcelliella pentastirinorum]WDR80232.1 DNA polymerase III subunit beta [Candidatus Purcelliella pentastirinorum]
MKFNLIREDLIKILKPIISPLSNKPKLPILSNIALKINNNELLLYSSNLEIDISAKIKIKKQYKPGATTVSGNKLFKICKNLPKKSEINFNLKNNKLLIYFKQSKFSISNIPYDQFPKIQNWEKNNTIYIKKNILNNLIKKTQFSMAKEDIRYYLNGIFLKIQQKKISSVATNGHRLAICKIQVSNDIKKSKSIIIPSKSIIELKKLINYKKKEEKLKIELNNNNIRIYTNNFIFTSRLIKNNFPDYKSILPKYPNSIIKIEKKIFQDSLNRVSILSNNKIKGVKLIIEKKILTIKINNQLKEEAEEKIEINKQNNKIEICFNIIYLLEIINILNCKLIKMLITDNKSAVQIQKNKEKTSSLYIIMPMKL